MFTIFFQRSLTLILLALAFATLPSLTYATNSWAGYHWARTANPFTLKLVDNLTTSDWNAKLTQASLDWNSPQTFSTTSPLVTAVTARATLIETDNAGPATYPQIAMAANGDAIVVWQQYDGTRYNIWANRYTTSSGWGTATLIETDNAGNADSPQIVMDTNGNAITVWQQFDGTRYNIWSNRYTMGSGWGTAILIETDNVGKAGNPQIAMDANGNAIAVWFQHDGVRYNTLANRYTTGNGWGAATLIETDNTGSAGNQQIAMNANGNAIVVWQQFDGTRYNIWANRYTTSSGWGTATLIETDNAGTAYFPQIAMNANGNATAVWRQNDGVRNNIWANRYTTGNGWGVATLIETDNAGDADSPQIAMDANGNTISVWYQYDGTRDNIWANRYTAGIGWGAATLIETAAGSARNPKLATANPQITMDANGNAITVWAQTDGRFNIWANRYTIGSGWGAATLVETASAGPALYPQIAMNDTGNAMAVWAQSDGTWTQPNGTHYNIWATNRFTNPSDCNMVTGTTQVCNGAYGSNGWLGLASVSFNSSLHITQATAKMNDTYFNTATYNNTNQRLHVMCQEVAHAFGLDHQSTNGSSQNSCMDYFSNTGANATSTLSTKPNLHDFQQLNTIYTHLDSTNTFTSTSSVMALIAKPTGDDPEDWGYLINQSADGRSSKYEQYHWDGSITATHVYWTNEAATQCPGCDHRYNH